MKPVTLFKALADPTRIKILEHLLKKEEMTCQDLMKKFSLSQPTLSHHFNKLVNAGILHSKKDGVLWIYSVNKQFLEEIGLDIKKFISHTKK
ncbi:MAG TPA: metalloregulator ArsR/SmtB family transcription factor [Patescibacteria group bacterium]